MWRSILVAGFPPINGYRADRCSLRIAVDQRLLRCARKGKTVTRNEAAEFFERELATIERVIGASCARSRLPEAELEDLASAIRMKLIENDYAAIRSFEGKSAFTTYLTVIVQRFIIDYRNQKWGRWIPSAEAMRLGDRAVAVETLLYRDGRSEEETFQILSADARLSVTRPELEDLVLRLPRRLPRTTTCALDDATPAHLQSDESSPERRFFAGEHERLGLVASSALDSAISTLASEDRLLLAMRFEDGLSVAQIARATGEDQRRLYYRLERLSSRLKQVLENSGVGRSIVRELLADTSVPLSLRVFGNRESERSNGTSRKNPTGEAATK